MITFPSFSEKNHTSFVLFGLFFVVFGWFTLSLAISGFFFFPLLVFALLIGGALPLLIGIKLLWHAKNDIRVVFFLSLCFAIFIALSSEPTVFSGRDQGSIAEAAFRLAQNNELAFTNKTTISFFEIYGEGTALNFPGFAYTDGGYLVTQFPLGYTAWLAAFVSVFGFIGPNISNALLLFLFFITLYHLLRLFVCPFYAGAGLLVSLFSFLPLWFAKMTLSENLALFLFTFLVFNLLLFFREGKRLYYFSILLTGGLFAFTRIEGFLFLGLSLLLLFFSTHAISLWKSSPFKSLVFPGIIFGFFFLRDFFINLPYYKMIGKALLKFLGQAEQGNIANSVEMIETSFPLGSVFFLYGLLTLFTMGLFGILIIIKERRFMALLPVAIALPTFLYLFDPNISLDHPWMLRRYLFSLFPTLLFSSIIGIALLFAKEKIFPITRPTGHRLLSVTIIFLLLISFQYPAWKRAVTFSENRSLIEQTAALSQVFTDRDLILIDRHVTGDGFSMITGPMQYLFNKNAVYFFNPHDLEKLNLTPYEHTYLLVPESDQERFMSIFGERLLFKKSILFIREGLESLSLEDGSALKLPEPILQETNTILFEIH
ncbi:MAG: hypothetical protein HYV45_01580 [Candidatus Moranbacteria bacterium]|nr:hypothetical protein [Candidatus Moranbacteria bacterium]